MKPVNKKDNRYFQYTVTVALNYEQIKKDPQRITKIKPFINKCNREGITFLSQKDDSRKFEQNNVTIALNILYANKEKICSAYVSKHNSNREKKNYYFNDSKWRKSKKSISTIKRNNF